jgi:5-methylcytosine-specific restriction protein A
MTGRSTEEWIGATADSAIPKRVKLRNFLQHGGKCHISGRVIKPGDAWDTDHIVALCNWTGEGHGNIESNLAPALRDKHKAKTKEDVAEKSRARKVKAKHLGLKPKAKAIIPGSKASPWKRKLDGTLVRR